MREARSRETQRARSARGIAAVAVAAGALLALAPSASAITRAQAGQAALKALAPQQQVGPVVVFGLPNALAKGTVVTPLSGVSRRLHGSKLRHREWLFWEDLAYGAEFEHPSVLMLVDDSSGRVIERKPLALYPLVNGKLPSFLASRGAYLSSRFQVYTNAPAAGAAAARAARRPVAGALSSSLDASAFAAQGAGPINAKDLKQDCMVTIGLRNDWAFKPDFAAMDSWATSVGLKHFDSGPTPAELTLTINRAIVADKCQDVLIFIAGHGTAPTATELTSDGRSVHMGPYNVTLGGGPAAIATSQTVNGGGKTVTQDQITPADIDTTMTTIGLGGEVVRTGKNGAKFKVKVKPHPKVQFKLKIESCFSQRFSEALAPALTEKNLAIVEYSSSKYEFSWGYVPRLPTYENGKTVWVTNNTINPTEISGFVNANVRGLEMWAANPQTTATETGGRGLVDGLTQAFSDGATQDFARDTGFTHPGIDTPKGHVGSQDSGGIPGQGAPPPAEFVAPTPQSAPAPIDYGSGLVAQVTTGAGTFAADVAYWFGRLARALTSQAGAAPGTTAPVDGTVTSVTLKGYAVSGDMPGPGGSEPIRFSVARPQPNGQLKVITTTTPPFTLPGTPGTYTFSMSQVSFPCCQVKAGDVVSLDARGGEFAVFGHVPGSVVDTFSMAGPTENAGYMWTGTPHQDLELLMRVTEQPSG